jgi:hypothetical protein
MGANVHSWAYLYLCVKDGEQCVVCRRKPPQVVLQIDHVDDNPQNNNPENLCLMCRTHNCAMRGKKIEHKRIIDAYRIQRENERDIGSASPATRFTKEVLDYHGGSVEMQANVLYEIKFINWLWRKLETGHEVTKKEATGGGSYISGANTQTVSRYLEPLVSEEGPLCEEKNEFGQVVIRFKPNLGTRH